MLRDKGAQRNRMMNKTQENTREQVTTKNVLNHKE